MTVTVIATVLLKLFQYLREQVESRLYSSITISSSNILFKKVNRFLVETDKIRADKVAFMKCKLKAKEGDTSWMDLCFGEDANNKKPQVEFLPGAGDHLFKNKDGKLMWINQSVTEEMKAGLDSMPTVLEELKISCYGQDPQPIKVLIEQAIDYSQQLESNMLKIYEVNLWKEWFETIQKKPRPIDSVILEGNIAQEMIEDV